MDGLVGGLCQRICGTTQSDAEFQEQIRAAKVKLAAKEVLKARLQAEVKLAAKERDTKMLKAQMEAACMQRLQAEAARMEIQEKLRKAELRLAAKEKAEVALWAQMEATREQLAWTQWAYQELSEKLDAGKATLQSKGAILGRQMEAACKQIIADTETTSSDLRERLNMNNAAELMNEEVAPSNDREEKEEALKAQHLLDDARKQAEADYWILRRQLSDLEVATTGIGQTRRAVVDDLEKKGAITPARTQHAALARASTGDRRLIPVAQERVVTGAEGAAKKFVEEIAQTEAESVYRYHRKNWRKGEAMRNWSARGEGDASSVPDALQGA